MTLHSHNFLAGDRNGEEIVRAALHNAVTNEHPFTRSAHLLVTLKDSMNCMVIAVQTRWQAYLFQVDGNGIGTLLEPLS